MDSSSVPNATSNVPMFPTLNDYSLNGSISISEDPRTLYVGNLDPSITEDFIRTLFSSFGRINSLKLFNDNLMDSYCFIEYDDHASATTALLTMNKRLCLDREIKVNWASNSSNSCGSKQDTSKHHHIFVGDLSSEIETQQLRDAFSVFGDISDCRVVRDSSTLKSKGYGFVSFVKKRDAENAIANMNGQWLGHRPIRTNWATRKMQNARNDNVYIGPLASNRGLSFEEVYNQSSLTNCTVYCGGIINGLDEDLIHKNFIRFGHIKEIRVFKDKGYAFIKFTSKDAAANAIVNMHNQEICGQTVKCSWGKESNDSSTNNTGSGSTPIAQSLAPASLIYPFNQQLSYWYPTFNTAGIPGTTANQYVPAAAAAVSLHHPSHAIQQPTVMSTYPMQGYQAQ
ncbi:nucleolysin TIAR-like protein [Sarcoptes scabiei]|uniref:Nucleolysin TIAR-like protein n=1 Tax=Sarcoptes scabiei TaxID=52283 RepID=A0A131ZT01_SARSC|nr:nucleolysin TIAR-like protein [Sarcoptes scabiei]